MGTLLARLVALALREEVGALHRELGGCFDDATARALGVPTGAAAGSTCASRRPGSGPRATGGCGPSCAWPRAWRSDRRGRRQRRAPSAARPGPYPSSAHRPQRRARHQRDARPPHPRAARV